MLKIWSDSLAGRVLLLALIAVLGSALLLTAMIEWMVLQNNRAQLVEQQKKTTELVARRIDNSLHLRTQALRELADQVQDGQQLLPEQELQVQLDSRINLHQHFNQGLFLVNAEGQLVSHSPYDL